MTARFFSACVWVGGTMLAGALLALGVTAALAWAGMAP